MTTRTAILSDIHGNSPAFEAVLDDIDRCGCSAIYILGDIINGMDPGGTLRLVRGLGERAVSIKGNAELYTLTPDLDALPDRDDPEHAGLIQLITYFRERLTADDLDWMARLPESVTWQGACLVHDSPLERFYPETWHIPGLAEKYQEWYFHARGIHQRTPEADWQRLWSWMAEHEAWGLFCGHTHAPLVRWNTGRVVCNAGGAGFPLDGDPRPSWALVEGEPGEGAIITIRRVDYDIDQAVQIVDETPEYLAYGGQKLREAYKKMLRTGIHWRAYIK